MRERQRLRRRPAASLYLSADLAVEVETSLITLPRSRFLPAAAGRGKGGPEAHPGGTRRALAAAKAAGTICGGEGLR